MIKELNYIVLGATFATAEFILAIYAENWWLSLYQVVIGGLWAWFTVNSYKYVKKGLSK